VGIDVDSLKKSLKPAERYALAFKEEIDPFYSIHAYNEWQRQQEKTDLNEEWNIDEIERVAQEEEEAAFEEGGERAQTTVLPNSAAWFLTSLHTLRLLLSLCALSSQPFSRLKSRQRSFLATATCT